MRTTGALISHGAGGSERGLQYLAKGLAENGWLAIVMGHRESGKDVLLNDLKGKSNRQDGLQQLVATPAAYAARRRAEFRSGLCSDTRWAELP